MIFAGLSDMILVDCERDLKILETDRINIAIINLLKSLPVRKVVNFRLIEDTGDLGDRVENKAL